MIITALQSSSCIPLNRTEWSEFQSLILPGNVLNNRDLYQQLSTIFWSLTAIMQGAQQTDKYRSTWQTPVMAGDGEVKYAIAKR